LSESHLILGLGEVLWDLLPDGAQLGGAPANFSVMAGRLGNHTAILSRIGRDDLGRSAMDRLDAMPVDASAVQIDPAHETGRVTVAFDAGQPRYTIHQPAAWDFLELTDEWVRLAERADAICFGSLAQRSLESRQTIQSLVAQTSSECVRVFDVNLRAPFYSGEVIQESLELATVMKMNDAELPLVLGLLGLPLDEGPSGDWLRLGALRLLEEFPPLEMVAITRGEHGSLLVKRKEWHEHPGIPGEGGRHNRGRGCVYGGADALPAARCRAGYAERGRKPVGRVGGLAAGRHARAAGRGESRDCGGDRGLNAGDEPCGKARFGVSFRFAGQPLRKKRKQTSTHDFVARFSPKTESMKAKRSPKMTPPKSAEKSSLIRLSKCSWSSGLP
jgi:fructokinase